MNVELWIMDDGFWMLNYEFWIMNDGLLRRYVGALQNKSSL